MISRNDEARILRLFHVEKWRVRAIAKEMGIHHSVVTRVLDRSGVAHPGASRPSRLDPYRTFIAETLERYPTITASRLFGMVKERGYKATRAARITFAT